MARPAPRSTVVLSDDEVTAQMKADYARPADIEQEMRERADLQRWAQRGYDAGSQRAAPKFKENP